MTTSKQYLKQLEYEIQLRNAWLSLVERYPNIYTFNDYRKACEQVGITLF